MQMMRSYSYENGKTIIKIYNNKYYKNSSTSYVPGTVPIIVHKQTSVITTYDMDTIIPISQMYKL